MLKEKRGGPRTQNYILPSPTLPLVKNVTDAKLVKDRRTLVRY